MADTSVSDPKAGPSKARVFVSYSRKDMLFADRLEAALTARGIETLIDRSEIYAFEDWWKRIEALIVQADTIVFVLSPDAVSSEVALKEIAFASSLNKRFAPIVSRHVDDKAIPEPVRRLNFIFFDDDARFEAAADRLAEALHTDIDWVRKHTEFGEAARRWAAAGRPGPRGLLLRSPVLEEAEHWIASRPEGAPAPTDDTQAFVEASRRAATRRRNALTASLGAGLVVALGLAGLAYGALYVAEIQRNDALIAQSRFLARDSYAATAEGNPNLGMLLALAALPRDIRNPDRPFVRDAERALGNAAANQRERLVIPFRAKGTWPGFHYAKNGKSLLVWDGNNVRVLDATTGAGIALIKGEDLAVTSTSVSPDGKRILIATEDGIVRLWDAQTGNQTAVLRGHQGRVTANAFSKDGSRVATAASDRTVRAWDAATGAELFVLRGYEHDLFVVEFSADGRRLLTLPGQEPPQLWDAATGARVAVLNGYGTANFSPDGATLFVGSFDTNTPPKLVRSTDGSKIADLAGHQSWVGHYPPFSPDGSRLLTVSGDKTAIIWDATSGKSIAVLRGHSDDLSRGAFSTDGTKIVTASADGTARLWDAKSGAPIAVLRGHDKRVFDASFSPDGKVVLTTGEDRTVRLWRADTGGLIGVLRGHQPGLITPFLFTLFAPDSARVWSASLDDKTVRLWDVKPGTEIAADHERYITAVLSDDGRRMVTFHREEENKTARLWDARTGQELALLRHDNLIWQAAFAPDGSRLVTASLDGTARIWDATTGAQLAVLQHPRDRWGSRANISFASFSPEGDRVVTAGEEDARVWDLKTGSQIAVLRGHERGLSQAVFSPEGTRVLTVSRGCRDCPDNSARIWNVKDGSVIAILGTHSDSIWDAMFSPDGTRVVTRSADGTARLWNAATNGQIAVVGGKDDSIGGVTLSPDGSRVAMRSKTGTRILDTVSGTQTHVVGQTYSPSAEFSPDGRVLATTEYSGASLWNVETGALLRTLRENGTRFARFFPDGKRILTAGQSVAVWDAATGDKLTAVPLTAIEQFDAEVRSVTISRDGTRLLVRSGDGAWLLRLPACQELIDSARAQLPRDLSDMERARYFLEKRAPDDGGTGWYETIRPWIDFALPHAGDTCP